MPDGSGEVLFRNDQWMVDEDGVQTVEGHPSYWFGAERLSETTERSGVVYYDWPLHLAEKTWVDVEEFIDAFKHALDLLAGKYEPTVDNGMLQRSLTLARKYARER